LISALVVCMTTCSCENGSPDSIGVVTPFHNEESEIHYITSTDKIIFPQFLENKDDISLFSRLLYTNFDYDLTNKPLGETLTVEGGYKCDMKFSNGKFFRFAYNKNYGIVDDKGNVKLQGVYSSIKQLRPDLFELIYNGSKTYATVDADNNFVFVEDDCFNRVFGKTKPEITQSVTNSGDNIADVHDAMKSYLKTPDGKIVYDRGFDSVVESSKKTLGIECESVFTAHSGGVCYVIVFDKFYNYKVYEGSYGNVQVQLSEKNGSCYILSNDHLLQIVNLFSCFDYEESKAMKPIDNFVSVELNSAKNNNTKYYICDNGYCEITSVSETGEAPVKTVYNVSKECFADVLEWINLVLSTEYTGV